MPNNMRRATEVGFIDPILDSFFKPSLFERQLLNGLGVNQMPTNIMKTDIKEFEDKYVVEMDVPGINKEDISIELCEGYLSISAKKEESKEEIDKGKYIRQERYYGSQTRKFYVGDVITEEDIKAKFDKGVLTLEVPKKEPRQPDKKTISID